MKVKQLKVNLWHKYILYYCIIFVIPFTLLSIVIFKFSLGRIEEQFNNTITNNLNQSNQILESQIEELQNIASEISKDKYLTPSRIEHNYYSTVAQDILSRYISSKPFIDDIVLYYFSNENKYYSCKGSYNEIQVLMSEYYQDIKISKWILRDIFYLTNHQIISLPSNEKGENELETYYIFPLYDSEGRQSGTIKFLINEDKMSDILPKVYKNNKSGTYVINNSNQVLLSNNSNLYTKIVDSNGKIPKKVFANYIYDIDESKYRIMSSEANELGLKFIHIINHDELSTLLMNAALDSVKILIIIFLCGLVLILGMSYYQYAPIKRIYSYFNDKDKIDKNELISIEKSIKDIISQNKDLKVKNERLHRIDKNQVFLELIEGINLETRSITNEQFISDIQNKGGAYCIGLIKKSQITKENKSVIDKLLNIKNIAYLTFNIQIPLQDKIVILVVHKDANTDIEKTLKDIQYKLESIETNANLYYGQTYDSIYKVNQSYIEAMIACDYINDDTENKYVMYKEVNHYSEELIKYPYDIEEKLAYGLKQGSKEVVQDSLKQVFEFIDINKYYREEMKIYTFYLISFIVKVAAQIDFDKEKINIKSLSSYKNIEEFKCNISKLINDINECVLLKKDKARDKFKEKIFIDINKNYRSHDLCLELLSQKYDYSISYLSKMIKEETGATFTKYIQELRFNYIKDQLVETEVPIKEIVYQAGYYDLSNFSRKFKKIMGVTPGQYREINRQKIEISKI